MQPARPPQSPSAPRKSVLAPEPRRASSFELRSNAFRLRITKTEVSKKTPSFWHVQHLVDVTRSENRDPAHSYAVGACCEPHRMDGGDDRVLSHLGHRLAPETVSDFGTRLSKDRHLARSLFESSQLELRILSRQFVAIRFQRIGIARPEVFEYGAAPCRIVDNYKSPRLT